MFVVRAGKSWLSTTKTVFVADNYMDCMDWVYAHIRKHEHMYIDYTMNLTEKDMRQIEKAKEVYK